MLKGIKITLFFVIATMSIAFSNTTSSVVTQAYVEKFKKIAVEEMHRTGIPASIKLAQAILESGSGTSELATKANNHFGIKCGGSWNGETFHKKDDDRNNLGMKVKSCFRAYTNPEESFKAHSEFLMNPSKKDRYGFLFDYKSTDYKNWAKGLKKAGYATNPKYPNLLMQVIEDNELHQYDYWKLSDIGSDKELANSKVSKETEIIAHSNADVKPKNEVEKENEIEDTEIIAFADNSVKPNLSTTKEKPSKETRIENVKKENIYDKDKYDTESTFSASSTKQSKVFYSNDIRTVSVEQGDTPESLAEKHNIDLPKLLDYNDLEPSQNIKTGDFIYLQPKRKTYRGKKSYHIVYQESMHDIAQRYGIQLKELCAKNMMTLGQEPENGQRINLKTKRKTAPKLKNNTTSIEEKLTNKANENIEHTKSKIAEVGNKIDEKIQFKYPKHTVKKGETLFSISKKYSVSVDDMQKWNNLKTNTLEIGQELIIKKR